MVIHDGSQLREKLRPERRLDEEIAAREPREEAVADEPVPEVRGKQAESATVRIESEVVAEAHPTCPKRTVCVHDTLGLSRGPGGEQDQCIVIQPDAGGIPSYGRPLRSVDSGQVHGLDPEPGEHGPRFRVRTSVPDRQPRLRPRRKSLDLERGEARVDGDDAPADSPGCQQLHEELVAVAEVDEDPLPAPKPLRLVVGDAGVDPLHRLLWCPAPASERFDESAHLQIEHHRLSIGTGYQPT